MKVEKEGGKLLFFQELYTEAKQKSEIITERLDEHYKQYQGDLKIDGSSTPAKTVRNITYELIESQISTNIPVLQVFPQVYTERADRCAKSIETYLNNKMTDNIVKRLNDIDERMTYIYGSSVWLVEWDESIRTHGTVGGVKLQCLPPTRFVPQPYVYNDVQDMEYCFIDVESTKEDLVRKYGVSLSVAEDTESERETDECATVHICFYKDENDNICRYIWSDDVELVDQDDYYARKRYVCKKCGKREELCECEEPELEAMSEDEEVVEEDIQLSDGTYIYPMSQVIEDGVPKVKVIQSPVLDKGGNPALKDMGGVLLPAIDVIEEPVLEKTVLPFYKPKRFPIIIRKNTSEIESLYGQSDCEFIRPEQQAINKVESRVLEKLMRASVTPVVPEDAEITLGNSVFGQVIKMKPGESMSQYGSIDTTPNISQDVAEGERLYDHAKRVLGISDSFQGQHDSSAQSGVAKQLQVMQAAGRLDSKRQMKNVAYTEIFRAMFELYLAYADEPRETVYKDAWGRWQNRTFNRYDFLDRDDIDGKWYYNDEFLFVAEMGADAEKNREYLWAENLKNFQAGAYGVPQELATQLIFWQNMESAHYPWAHDNVERLREQITGQMQAMQQQIAEQEAAMEKEKESREIYEQGLRDEIFKLKGEGM